MCQLFVYETSMKERLHFIDIAKGTLMVMLMISHTLWVAKTQKIDNSNFDTISGISPTWTCFFMPAFFIITGSLSNFNKDFGPFLNKNFKSILFPALIPVLIHYASSRDIMELVNTIILWGGGQWFLCALFIGKLILWFFNKLFTNRKLLFFPAIIMLFLALFLEKYVSFPNYWYHRHGLFFIFYLVTGFVLKDRVYSKKTGIFSMCIFIVLFFSLFYMGCSIPTAFSAINVDYGNVLTHILLATTGSFALYLICKQIKRNRIFEYLGKNSLIIYIYHIYFIHYTLILLSKAFHITNANMMLSILIIAFVVSIALVGCGLLAKMFQYRYLRWMKGDF